MNNNTTTALADLRSAALAAFASGATYKEVGGVVERELLRAALEVGGGDYRAAAMRLGIKPDHFAYIVGVRHPELSQRRQQQREAVRVNARPNHSRPARRAPGRVLPFKLPPGGRGGR